MTQTGYSFAVDIGGTFTDVVLRHGDGQAWSDKTLTTYSDLLDGFFAADHVITLTKGTESHCFYALDAAGDGTSDAAAAVCASNAGKITGLGPRVLALKTGASLGLGTWTLTIPQNALRSAPRGRDSIAAKSSWVELLVPPASVWPDSPRGSAQLNPSLQTRRRFKLVF